MTWGVPLSVSYHYAFSYCSWSSQGKNTEVVCHFLLQWTTFCQTSPSWPACFGWPHTAWLSFIELDKAVVLVLLDWLVFCDYGFSVSALKVQRPRVPGCDGAEMAERSYPMSEVRGGGWECQAATAQEQPRGAIIFQTTRTNIML